MFRASLKVRVAALVLLGTASIVACGGDDDDGGTAASPTAQAAAPTATTAAAAAPTATVAAPAPTATTAAPPAAAAIAVNIVDFGYGPETISAKVGQAVALNVTNGGNAPHTLTIAGVVDTGTMSSGQTRSISFTPTAAGELQFICTIHGAATMSGKVIVAP